MLGAKHTAMQTLRFVLLCFTGCCQNPNRFALMLLFGAAESTSARHSIRRVSDAL